MTHRPHPPNDTRHGLPGHPASGEDSGSLPADITELFLDVDDTLYPPESGVWTQIGRNIDRYMVERIGFSAQEVTSTREHYFREYGTTLNGLRALHGVDPQEYLTFVHNIPVAEYLQPDPALRRMLAGLPQRRWIFSNADAAYIGRVLDRLGVADLFEGIIDIFATDFACKPLPESYARALVLAGSPPSARCLIVDDQLRNLDGAAQAGFRTAWVNPHDDRPANGHRRLRRIHDLAALLR